MGSFYYKVRKNGVNTEGIIEGTREGLRKKFIDEGYILIDLDEKIKKTEKKQKEVLYKYKKLNAKKLSEFCSEFSILLEAGITIPDSMKIMIKNEKNKFYKELLESIEKDVNKGVALSQSISKTGVFPKLFEATLKTGEFSGEINKVLGVLGAYYEKIDANKSKIIGASIYPGLLFVFLIANLLVMSTKVIPVFKELFSDMGPDLPLVTQMVFSIADFLNNNILIIIALLVTIPTIFFFTRKSVYIQKIRDYILLSIPVVHKLVVETVMSTFLKSLALLINSGSTMIDALELSLETIDNYIIKKSIEDDLKGVEKGKSLTQLLANNKYLNNVAKSFIEIGENSAKIDTALEKAVYYYNKGIDKKIDIANRLMEPAMIVFMGGIVAVVVVAIAFPIFNLTKGIQ
jgi:type IV pilus assembly protein PilC